MSLATQNATVNFIVNETNWCNGAPTGGYSFDIVVADRPFDDGSDPTMPYRAVTQNGKSALHTYTGACP
jgi:hypothetical protein